jgi:prepilin-type N-terminal cleavage/methylation domain-containing protein
MFLRKKKGFTLIELLVVIAIIGILATIVLVSLNTARVKARDARRSSDMHQIALAMEMCYDDSTCGGGTSKYLTSAAMPTAISTFMTVVPKDPQTGNAYGWISNASDDQSYCTYATLEVSGAGVIVSNKNGTKSAATAPASMAACNAL